MLVCGAASALGFAPLGWWPVWVGAVACFLVCLSQAPWQRQGWLGCMFGLGAATGSLLWFVGLGVAMFGLGRRLNSVAVWRTLDGLVAVMMWGTAGWLLVSLV